jgi:hypothetical protein
MSNSAPTATAAGSRSCFRSAATAGFLRFAFDADNGKDQDRALARSAIHD